MCSLASSPSLQSARKTRCWGLFSVFLFNHLWLKMFFKFTLPSQNFISSLAPLPTLITPPPLQRKPQNLLCPLSQTLPNWQERGPWCGGWLSVSVFAEKETRLSSSVFPSLSGAVYSWLVSADAPKGSRWCKLQTEAKSEPAEPQLPSLLLRADPTSWGTSWWGSS